MPGMSESRVSGAGSRRLIVKVKSERPLRPGSESARHGDAGAAPSVVQFHHRADSDSDSPRPTITRARRSARGECQ